jgi:hypothetical protein
MNEVKVWNIGLVADGPMNEYLNMGMVILAIVMVVFLANIGFALRRAWQVRQNGTASPWVAMNDPHLVAPFVWRSVAYTIVGFLFSLRIEEKNEPMITGLFGLVSKTQKNYRRFI